MHWWSKWGGDYFNLIHIYFQPLSSPTALYVGVFVAGVLLTMILAHTCPGWAHIPEEDPHMESYKPGYLIWSRNPKRGMAAWLVGQREGYGSACTESSIQSELSKRNWPQSHPHLSLSFLLDFDMLAKYFLHPTLHPWLHGVPLPDFSVSELIYGMECLRL